MTTLLPTPADTAPADAQTMAASATARTLSSDATQTGSGHQASRSAAVARLAPVGPTPTDTANAAPVSFGGVLAAAEALARHLTPTPAWRYAALNVAASRDVVVKHENMNPTGSFKVRGGLTLAAQLTADERTAGLVTCSTGNHAQSIAFAASVAGTRAVIVMPECAPAVKVDAVRALGADVIIEGPTLAEASAHARHLADTRGMRFVNPGNDPAIIHGHATLYLELLQSNPEVEEIYVPIGSGSGAAGACLVRDAIAPHVRVIGVQSDGATAAFDSWTSGAMECRPADTRVSGLATARGFEVPQSVMRGDAGGAGSLGLQGFDLVSDDEIDAAAALLARHAHVLAEGAGAAALAGLVGRMRSITPSNDFMDAVPESADDATGRPSGSPSPLDAHRGAAAVVVTGGNVSGDEWARLVAALA